MSLLDYLPGKIVAKSSGKGQNRPAQKPEALHNSFMRVSVHDDRTDYESRAVKIVDQFKDKIKNGASFSIKPQFLAALLDGLTHNNAIDDRKMLLEHALVLISRLPKGTLAQTLQDQAIQLLYYDLPHPPATYVGKHPGRNADGSANNVSNPKMYQWRSADGSGNNVSIPEMGKAGSNYSRSVQASHAFVASELPDPNLIFQSLLKRDTVAGFERHPGGLSSLMFGFATLVIHTIFRTSFADPFVNETSSYIDLAPLYGNDEKTQHSVRDMDVDRDKFGRGLLYPDVFAEDRLLLLPPASAVILVLFNRNHNYIANKIFSLNERGGYKDPATLDISKREAQDEELFQTARLVNCMWFAQVVFSDYFATILGLVRDGSSWNLNPFGQMRKLDHTMVERGQGNSVSIEFNILYRWHVTMSEDNVKWTEAMFREVFDNRPLDKLGLQDFRIAMGKEHEKIGNDPTQWHFGNMDRQADGRFKNEDLAKILHDATFNPASAFKARGSPEVMRIIEIMGIKQARSWGACSLNDFRRFLGLKPYANFEEWNKDPEISETARRLYGDIENLELYPGLQAEQPKPRVPGAGLCPSYTTSRAILSDAISLCRGDRFYTADLTPWNLTAWGFQDCQRDTSNGGFGSMLGRLFLRTLPEHYTHDSVYTWFAFMTPEEMKTDLTKLNIAHKYSFDRPGCTEEPHLVTKFHGVSSILKDRAAFRDSHVERAKELISGQGYLLSLDNPSTHKADSEIIIAALAGSPQGVEKAAQFYLAKTRELIKENSFELYNFSGKHIDIVGKVLNLVPIHFVSTLLAGLPLKTKENPHGIYEGPQLLQMFREIFAYVFFKPDPAKRMQAKTIAKEHTQELLKHIKSHLKEISSNGDFFYNIIHFFENSGNDQSMEFLRRISENKKPRDELANDVFSLALLASVEFSQALVHIVNMYLKDGHDSQDKHAKHREDIIRLAQSKGGDADAKLEAYAREALRLDPSLRGTYRHAQKDSAVDGIQVNKNKLVFLSFADANIDPDVFDDPNEIDPSRSIEGYLSLNDAVYGALGDKFVTKMAAQVLRAVFELPNLHRTEGPTGTLGRVVTAMHGTTNYEYLDVNRELSPWARSMVLQYDVKKNNRETIS